MNKGDPNYVLMKNRPQRKRARQGLMADAQEAVLRMEKRAREGEYAHMTLPHHIATHPPPLLNPSNRTPVTSPPPQHLEPQPAASPPPFPIALQPRNLSPVHQT